MSLQYQILHCASKLYHSSSLQAHHRYILYFSLFSRVKMSTQRNIYLLKFRNNSRQRWHFALYLQNPAYENIDPADKTKHGSGHMIHVVGAPMNGYGHEFVTNFAPHMTTSLKEAPLLGKITVPAGYIIDPADDVHKKRYVAQDQFEKDASTVAAPRKSENFMAPVDGVGTNHPLPTPALLIFLLSPASPTVLR